MLSPNCNQRAKSLVTVVQKYHPQNNHFDLDRFCMWKLAIFGLFEYIQYGHRVKIIDSNMVANTGAQKNGQTAVFGVILAIWWQVSDFEG